MQGAIGLEQEEVFLEKQIQGFPTFYLLKIDFL